MEAKLRKTCILCGARKYKKYMKLALKEYGGWICKNRVKCEKRSANYKV